MIRFPKSIVALLVQRMPSIGKNIQRLVEEHLFTFPPGNLVLNPTLFTISTIPIETLKFRKDLHGPPHVYSYYIRIDMSIGIFADYVLSIRSALA